MQKRQNSSKKKSLEHFSDILRIFIECFRAAKIQVCIIGGIAASLVGKSRYTQDIDVLALLDLQEVEKFLKIAKDFGFLPRLKDPLKFAEQTRMLLLTHSPSAIDVDISLGALPFEQEVIERSSFLDFEGTPLPIASPEDLIIMKGVAHRPQDMMDIESILDAHSKLDFRRIFHWLKQFAEVLEKPEILGDVERLSARKKAGKSARN